jgi:HAD superfamily hydrolase (TIGR01509 family)
LEVYRAHGEELPFDRWIQTIGSSNAGFDPRGHLEERLGRKLTPEVLERRMQHRTELILAKAALPGVSDLLAAARDPGLKVGVASSSNSDWVRGHLDRLGILNYFDCMRCRDNVAQVKPAPDLYVAVLECLGVGPDEAVAIEDSPNGIVAAKAAGMLCVVIPNPITARLDLSQADLLLPSLAGVTLADLAEKLGLKIAT